jgi:hypothetical protein
LNNNKIKIRKLVQLNDTIFELPDNVFSLKVFIKDNQEFNLMIDTGSVILWIQELNFIKSPFLINLTNTFDIKYGTGYCKGYYVKDTINIFNNNINVTFGLSNDNDFNVTNANGIIGFPKTYSMNKDVLIIDKLKKNKIISKNIFSIKFSENKIFIGEEHNDFKNNNNYGYCDIYNRKFLEDILWQCDITLIYFGEFDKNIFENKSIILNSLILFDTGSNRIVFNLKYIHDFTAQLNSNLEKENCQYILDEKNIHGTIICLDYDKIPNISFVIGDYLTEIPKEILWIEDKNIGFYQTYILFNKNVNNVILGAVFFKFYHTLFNGEKNRIKFYSEKNNKIIKVGVFMIKYRQYFIIGIILIISVIVLGIIIIFYKKYYTEFKNDIENGLDINLLNKNDFKPPNNTKKNSKILELLSVN